jgi:hypothetical protein
MAPWRVGAPLTGATAARGGIHRAHQSHDPHKMMLMPLTASVVLVKHERDLEAAFSQQAPYLFHAGAGELNWDQGLRSFTCSRRIDALKLGGDSTAAPRTWALSPSCATTARFMSHPQRPAFEALHVRSRTFSVFVRGRPVGPPWG